MTEEQKEKYKTILDRNGFDFDAFEYENEYSAKNLLSAINEIFNSRDDRAMNEPYLSLKDAKNQVAKEKGWSGHDEYLQWLLQQDMYHVALEYYDKSAELCASQFRDRLKELEADITVKNELIESTGKENIELHHKIAELEEQCEGIKVQARALQDAVVNLQDENERLRKENKDIWIKACQAQNENISTGFNDNLDKLEDDPKGKSIFRQIAKSIKTYPLAEFNASTPPSEANKTE